ARASESARSMNALAYTVGRHVVFGEGQYSPGTAEGKKLLAHGLVHVGQQSQAPGNDLTSGAPAAGRDGLGLQRRVKYFVCEPGDQTAVNQAHGQPVSYPVETLRAAADAASDTAANWAVNAVALLRTSPRSAAIRSAFRDAFAAFPEWVPPW